MKIAFAALALAGACVLPAHAARFTLVVHETRAELAARTQPDHAASYWAAWGEYAQSMQAAGILRGGMPLKGASGTGASAVDAEVSGVFLIEAADAVEARRWAARAPRGARVEAREEFPAPAMR